MSLPLLHLQRRQCWVDILFLEYVGIGEYFSLGWVLPLCGYLDAFQSGLFDSYHHVLGLLTYICRGEKVLSDICISIMENIYIYRVSSLRLSHRNGRISFWSEQLSPSHTGTSFLHLPLRESPVSLYRPVMENVSRWRECFVHASLLQKLADFSLGCSLFSITHRHFFLTLGVERKCSKLFVSPCNGKCV